MTGSIVTYSEFSYYTYDIGSWKVEIKAADTVHFVKNSRLQSRLKAVAESKTLARAFLLHCRCANIVNTENMSTK